MTQEIMGRGNDRKLAIMVAISLIPHPTEKNLTEAVGIPKRSVHSTFKLLRDMNVVIDRVKGRRHGYYLIADSGCFNLNRVHEVIQEKHPVIYNSIKSYAIEKDRSTPVAGTNMISNFG